ncbi:Gfo/Idh/MocA family oxidoreductase [bacterium]|nr:Gfo/Idh/MocA family oxidoreductase [bacterium]
MTPLRIGVLGAARITPMALLRPARRVPEAAITAVAARDPARARAFAARHGIPRVHDSYAALVADPEIDAIYNPLPNSHHCEWTIRALEAGKHVLCEKPLASNAGEARQMAEAAGRSGRRLVEAFHWRFHPLAARMREVVDSGVLGTVRHVEATMCIPLPLPNDIRYRFELAGGATMDVGCYTISVVRFLAGSEPEVLSATARLARPDVDRAMTAELAFPGGVSGRITCSLFSLRLLKVEAIVRGDRGEMRVFNPYLPQLYHRLSLRTAAGRTSERVAGDATYTHQLRAFVAAVRDGTPTPTDPPHAIANMAVIDAVYRKAGLPLRGPSPASE